MKQRITLGILCHFLFQSSCDTLFTLGPKFKCPFTDKTKKKTQKHYALALDFIYDKNSHQAYRHCQKLRFKFQEKIDSVIFVCVSHRISYWSIKKQKNTNLTCSISRKSSVFCNLNQEEEKLKFSIKRWRNKLRWQSTHRPGNWSHHGQQLINSHRACVCVPVYIDCCLHNELRFNEIKSI